MRRRQILISPDTKLVRTGGRPPRLVMWLIGIQLGFFLLYAFADGPRWVSDYLALSSDKFFGHRYLWQLLTAPWLHLGHQFQLLVTDLLWLWFFGTPLERYWGRAKLLAFWWIIASFGLLCSVTATTFGAFSHGSPSLPIILSGPSAATMGITVAFGKLFADHLIQFYGVIPMRAKWLSLAMGSFVVIGTLVSGDYHELIQMLAGAFAAFVYLMWTTKKQKKPPRGKTTTKSPPFVVISGGKPSNPHYWN